MGSLAPQTISVGTMISESRCRNTVVCLPFLQVAFNTVLLGIDKGGIIILTSESLFVIEEAREALFPRLFSLANGNLHTGLVPGAHQASDKR